MSVRWVARRDTFGDVGRSRRGSGNLTQVAYSVLEMDKLMPLVS